MKGGETFPASCGKSRPVPARQRLGSHSETSVFIGDRMESDIVAGMTTGMETILVLSGMTQRGQVARFPYQPTRMVVSVADITIG
jgi:NagD protein